MPLPPLPNQGPAQPFQLASRDVGQGFPGVGILQQLLGREGQPNLPPTPQVSMQELLANQAGGGDLARLRNIRQIIERRNADFTSPAPKTSAETIGPQDPAKEKKKKEEGLNALVKALEDALNPNP